ncbi:MAG: hypothetical protein U1E61_17075 [Bradyrhizobium sp.]
MHYLELTVLAASLGAVAICIVSAIDFHAPYGAAQIRYAVMRGRYYFAVVVYCAIAVTLYLPILQGFYLLAGVIAPRSELQWTIAIPAAIAFMVLAPHVPILSRIVNFLRTMMQTLARYPQMVETVTAAIARSPIRITEAAKPELLRELEGYGVPPLVIEQALAHNDKVLAPGAATMILQVASLHTSFIALRNNRRFEKFFAARKAAFDEMEKQYRRMLRRSARALLLTDNILVSDVDAQELVLEISDFISEECEELRAAYQRRLAEIALSIVDSRDSRTSLISSFGYQIVLPQPLPFAPLVTIFLVDFAVSVAPLFPMASQNQSKKFEITTVVGCACAIAHAAALTISIFLAVYPKAATNFARPSLFALPWSSYVVFGLFSYVVGYLILGFTYASIELAPGWLAHSHPLSAAALFALIFPINTLVLSILLDIRLRGGILDYHEARLRDGATHAIVMMCVMFSLLVGFAVMTTSYGLTMPDISLSLYALIIGLTTVLGLVMGYLVPSTAAVYIEANKLVRKSGRLEGVLLGWAVPESYPGAAADS